MKYRVLKEGVSQRDEKRRMVDVPIGAEVELSPAAAKALIESGHIEAPEGKKRQRGDA